ncbi:MAG: response regulator transcription factor, partial [Anaerolineaceae bacterium]|nr:response regulator transcription factor [Anaerolineaceae bacterium]
MVQRILVVDDDREIVRLVKAYLERSGYEVLVAYDGESALHMLRRERPDLMLLDLMLPGRDGLDVTRVVRSDGSLAALPIIVLTARVEDQDKIVGLELGADDYVTKPFNPGEVVARVRAVLRRVHGEIAQPMMLRAGDVVVDLDRHQVTVAGQVVHLTPTEFGLLRALAEEAGR